MTRITDQVPVAPSSWPARSDHGLDDALDRIGPTTRIVRRGAVRVDENLVPFDLCCDYHVIGKTRAGVGMVLEVSPLDAQGATVTPERRNLVFISKIEPPETENGDARPGQPEERIPAERDNPLGQFGIHFELTEPAGNATPRAIAIQLHGLGGIEYEKPLMDELSDRGFLVLATDYPWARWHPQVLTMNTEQDVMRCAAELAAMTDDCLAEAAFAVEGALEYLRRTRPELAEVPVVLLGFSAGSLATPTVAARLGDGCAAVVLVGSGSNIVHIAQESELTTAGLTVMRFGHRATGAMAGLLSGLYLEKSRLDPYHCAAALRRTPVLMLQGTSDTIVPSQLGDELYERLGRPDRWLCSGGHRSLFLRLGGYSKSIADWVELNGKLTRTVRGDGDAN